MVCLPPMPNSGAAGPHHLGSYCVICSQRKIGRHFNFEQNKQNNANNQVRSLHPVGRKEGPRPKKGGQSPDGMMYFMLSWKSSGQRKSWCANLWPQRESAGTRSAHLPLECRWGSRRKKLKKEEGFRNPYTPRKTLITSTFPSVY